jgi:anti-sigma regulatory factor (Ser/Thr protein kinase)
VRQRCEVRREGKSINVIGHLKEGDYKKVLAAVHQAVAVAGFDDLILDFTDCQTASPGCMLPICASMSSLRASHHSTDIRLPSSDRLRRLFVNANWAHLISPRTFDPATRVIAGQMPATRFATAEDQQASVNRLIDALLSNTSGFSRKEFQAIEWVLNEITDNVLNHAQSTIGGFVQLSVLERAQRVVELVVADPGVGIPDSLRSTRPGLTDIDALDLAIREGVTRDTTVGQGNGLFGTFQICEKSAGRLRIDSGHGSLTFSVDGGVHLRSEGVPMEGTVIDAQVGLGAEGALSLALAFGGRIHTPVDLIENKYETDAGTHIDFSLTEEAASFGSRIAARPIRMKLKNILDMCPGQRIRVDFQGVRIVSSSFADEVFGRLFVELGPMAFMGRFEFVGLDQTVRMLIDRAISQRAVTDLGGRLAGHTPDAEGFAEA